MTTKMWWVVSMVVMACDRMPADGGGTEEQELTLGAVNPADPAIGAPGNNSTTWSTSGSQVSFRGQWVITLSLPVGQPVPPITVTVRDNAATCSTCFDGDNVHLQIVSSVGSSTPTTLADTLTCGCGAAGSAVLTAPASHLVADREVLQIVADTFTLFPNASTRQDAITAVQVGVSATGTMMTKVIAPSPTGIQPYTVIDVTAGIGNSTINLDGYFDVGDHIRAIRIYAQDNTLPGPAVGYSGPTEIISRLKLYSPSTGSVPTTLATSDVSNGSGTVQVLSMTGLDVAIVKGGTTHSLQTIDNIGVAPTVVWSVEVDYTATAPSASNQLRSTKQ